MFAARLSFVLHLSSASCLVGSEQLLNIPKYASRSLNPLLPCSKLLCVTASHLTSSPSTLSPPGPSILMYASSKRFGSSLTLRTPPCASGRIRKGAVMRGGVFCHRGLSAASVSYSGACDGVVLENVHAEVRTRDAFEGAGRSGDDVAEKRQRSGRRDAIEAVGACGITDWAGRGVGVKAYARGSDGSKSCGFIPPCPKQR
jgi:hypothetical protein